MNSLLRKQEHDLLTAFLNLQDFIDLAESGYDFSTSRGRSLIEAARKAISCLETRNVLTIQPVSDSTIDKTLAHLE